MSAAMNKTNVTILSMCHTHTWRTHARIHY